MQPTVPIFGATFSLILAMLAALPSVKKRATVEMFYLKQLIENPIANRIGST